MLAQSRTLLTPREADSVLRSLDGIVSRVDPSIACEVHECRMAAFVSASRGTQVDFLAHLLKTESQTSAPLCVGRAAYAALGDDDATDLICEYVKHCSPADARTATSGVDRVPDARRGSRLAVALMERRHITPEIAHNSVTIMRAVCELTLGDPTVLMAERGVPALARAAATDSWLVRDAEILQVVQCITLEGPVPHGTRGAFEALFTFAGSICSNSHTVNTAWSALAVVLEAVREGAPGRYVYLGTPRATRVLECVVERGHSANSPSRRRMFLQYCASHLEGRPRDARAFIENGGVRAVAACARVDPRCREMCDKAILACCVGIEYEERGEVTTEYISLIGC